MVLRFSCRYNLRWHIAYTNYTKCSFSGILISLQTNMPYILNLLKHKDFLEGTLTTDFIMNNPELFDVKRSQNRAQKLLQYLGNVLVNGPVTPLATGLKPSKMEPVVPDVSYNYNNNNNNNNNSNNNNNNNNNKCNYSFINQFLKMNYSCLRMC